MKKYFLLAALSFATLGTVASCDNSISNPVNDVDSDTYSVAYDNTGTFTKAGSYALTFTFPKPIYNSDVVLVYRLKSIVNGQKVWEQIPKTIYSNAGELDYDFDFTTKDVQIFTKGNYDISTTPEYLTNQTFRIVVVPADLGKSASAAAASYETVSRVANVKVVN